MAAVFRAGNGYWYARHEGRISDKHSTTQAQAQAHLDKLQRGLVKFQVLGTGAAKAPLAQSNFKYAHASIGTRK